MCIIQKFRMPVRGCLCT